MRGANPIRKPEKGDGSVLQVKHIFPTLQGEGPYAGHRAVFVRLGGCNLSCDFCDTDFEAFEKMAVEDILEKVNTSSRGLTTGPRETNTHGIPQSSRGMTKIALVVITGGEPLRQPIERLCRKLIAGGYTVQIETNGTLWRELPPEVEIVCSPKNTGQGYARLRPDLLPRVNALKFLLSASREDYGHVPDVGQDDGIPVYVQPMDEYDDAKNRANRDLAAKLAVTHGYRLSLQLHKLLGIE